MISGSITEQGANTNPAAQWHSEGHVKNTRKTTRKAQDAGAL